MNKPCSAMVNYMVCSNGFPLTAPCSGIAGIPWCLNERVCARLYPETGMPDRCILPENYLKSLEVKAK